MIERMRRIGHKGADLIEPGNTLASFDAALAHGVDMIELDVLPERRPPSRPTRGRPPAPGARLRGRRPSASRSRSRRGSRISPQSRFAGIEFIVDLKLPGYERRVVDALAAAGLRDRAMVSSTYKESLVRLRAYDPDLRVGLVGAAGAPRLHEPRS